MKSTLLAVLLSSFALPFITVIPAQALNERFCKEHQQTLNKQTEQDKFFSNKHANCQSNAN